VNRRITVTRGPAGLGTVPAAKFVASVFRTLPPSNRGVGCGLSTGTRRLRDDVARRGVPVVYVEVCGVFRRSRHGGARRR
jgi:hypothetical protein